MAVAVLVYRALLPPDSLPILVGAVVLGAAVYVGSVLAPDPSVRAEVAGLVKALL
jgi:hypothetical protein